MATLPEDVSDDLRLVIDELESAIADMESRLESARAERDEAKARQVELAIENVRLFNETKEALERQTATADILKVIASSPTDVQPVFDAIVTSAAKLFEPCSADDHHVERRETALECGRRTRYELRSKPSAGHVSDNSTRTAHLRLAPFLSAALSHSRPRPPIRPIGLRTPQPRAAFRHPSSLCRWSAETMASARIILYASAGRIQIFGRATRAPAKFRRPGRDRHRERAAVQRDQGGAGAADRDGRHPQGDRQFAVGRAAGVRRHRRSSSMRLIGGSFGHRFAASAASYPAGGLHTG